MVRCADIWVSSMYAFNMVCMVLCFTSPLIVWYLYIPPKVFLILLELLGFLMGTISLVAILMPLTGRIVSQCRRNGFNNSDFAVVGITVCSYGCELIASIVISILCHLLLPISMVSDVLNIWIAFNITVCCGVCLLLLGSTTARQFYLCWLIDLGIYSLKVQHHGMFELCCIWLESITNHNDNNTSWLGRFSRSLQLVEPSKRSDYLDQLKEVCTEIDLDKHSQRNDIISLLDLAIETRDAKMCICVLLYLQKSNAFAEIESVRGDVTLTVFEFNTLAALLIFVLFWDVSYF